jgi:hypothetical protein
MANTLSNLFERQLKPVKAKEQRHLETTEIGEMQQVISELRSEHAKLLAELQKLVKETKGETAAQPLPPQQHFIAPKHHTPTPKKPKKPKVK